jgi:hypothetical protein
MLVLNFLSLLCLRDEFAQLQTASDVVKIFIPHASDRCQEKFFVFNAKTRLCARENAFNHAHLAEVNVILAEPSKISIKRRLGRSQKEDLAYLGVGRLTAAER